MSQSPLTLSAFLIPAIDRVLANLSHVLAKGETFARGTGLDPAQLVQARLAPDMFTLAGQVQRASDTAKAAAARLADVEVPSYPDDEQDFAQLQDRIRRTRDFIASVDVAKMDGCEGRTISFKAGPYPLTFTGTSYARDFVLPNLHFHASTAYGILRHNGVPVGKLDYLGPIN
jgi:hypothetical protein